MSAATFYATPFHGFLPVPETGLVGPGGVLASIFMGTPVGYLRRVEERPGVRCAGIRCIPWVACGVGESRVEFADQKDFGRCLRRHAHRVLRSLAIFHARKALRSRGYHSGRSRNYVGLWGSCAFAEGDP